MSVQQTPPPGELRDVDVQFVSLVKRGANKRTFQIFKSADYKDDDAGALEAEETKQAVGFFRMVKEFFTGGKAEIAKQTGGEPQTFAQVFNQQRAREELWQVFSAIETVFWNIVRSDAANKRQLVERSLDEFRTAVLERFDTLDSLVKTAIAKEQFEVEKAGRKISAERLQALIAARDYLNKVIEEATADDKGPEAPDITIEKEDGTEMKAEEFQQLLKSAINEALAPVNQRIERLEKAAEGENAQEGAEKQQQPAAELTPEAISKSIKEAVAEAVKPLDERLSKIEKAYPLSNQPPEEGGSEVRKSVDDGFWGGLFSV